MTYVVAHPGTRVICACTSIAGALPTVYDAETTDIVEILVVLAFGRCHGLCEQGIVANDMLDWQDQDLVSPG